MSESPFTISFNHLNDRKEYEVMFAGRSQTHPLHNLGPLIHHYYLIHYVIAGKGEFRGMGKQYTLTSGDSFFIFPGELVQYTSDAEEPWQYCWVAFRGERFAELLRRMEIAPEQPIVQAVNRRRMLPLYDRIMKVLARRDNNTGLIADGYLRILLGEYATDRFESAFPPKKASSIIDAQIDYAIQVLTHRYYQPISIAELAREIGYHRTHFSKMFKARTGMSPMAFLLKIRMDHARRMLRGNLTIEQVAASVGFSDPLYFSKQFKKQFGKPPTHYR